MIPVSVVIPFYRGAATIRRALASIEAQTVKPAEIVIVDDGSPEPVPDGLEGTVPLRVVRHAHNRGIPAARNTGVDAAAGEWVAFIDQDDEWRPWKLEEQWRVVEKGAAERGAAERGVAERGAAEQGGAERGAAERGGHDRRLIYSRAMSVGEPDPREEFVRPPARCDAPLAAGGEAALRCLARRGNVVPFITVLVPRDALRAEGGLDEAYRGGADDAELILRLAARGWRLVQASPPGREAALHHWTGSNYSDPLKWHDEEVRAWRDLAERHAEVARSAGRALARTHFKVGRHQVRLGQVAAARGHYRAAIRHAPLWWKPWAAFALSMLGR